MEHGLSHLICSTQFAPAKPQGYAELPCFNINKHTFFSRGGTILNSLSWKKTSFLRFRGYMIFYMYLNVGGVWVPKHLWEEIVLLPAGDAPTIWSCDISPVAGLRTVGFPVAHTTIQQRSGGRCRSGEHTWIDERLDPVHDVGVSRRVRDLPHCYAPYIWNRVCDRKTSASSPNSETSFCQSRGQDLCNYSIYYSTTFPPLVNKDLQSHPFNN